MQFLAMMDNISKALFDRADILYRGFAGEPLKDILIYIFL
jgi:hypothetical protein